MTLKAFNFNAWIDEHRHLLKPPVGARRVFEDAEFIIMVVGGPNTRKDYHLDPGEEFFYQLEGDMTLKIVEDGQFRDVEIREGDIFLLPPNVPHSPQRRANTVGLVIERKRHDGEMDGARWYCDACGHVLHEAFFNVNDGGLLPQLNAAIEVYHADEGLRTCDACGEVQSVPGRGGDGA